MILRRRGRFIIALGINVFVGRFGGSGRFRVPFRSFRRLDTKRRSSCTIGVVTRSSLFGGADGADSDDLKETRDVFTKKDEVERELKSPSARREQNIQNEANSEHGVARSGGSNACSHNADGKFRSAIVLHFLQAFDHSGRNDKVEDNKRDRYHQVECDGDIIGRDRELSFEKGAEDVANDLHQEQRHDRDRSWNAVPRKESLSLYI